MPEERINLVSERDDISPGNSSLSKTDQLRELVNALVGSYQQAARVKPRRWRKSASSRAGLNRA